MKDPNNQKLVETAIGNVLKPLSFHKKGAYWYKATTECVLVVNLQRSSWSDLFYINLGVSVLTLNSNPTPKEYDCHIRVRLSSVPGCSSTLDRALDFDELNLDAQHRISAIEAAVRKCALPFFASLDSLEKIKDTLTTKNSLQSYTHGSLKEYLELPIE